MSLDSYLWVLIKKYLWTFIASTPENRNKTIQRKNYNFVATKKYVSNANVKKTQGTRDQSA
jgi:hypothetical protein